MVREFFFEKELEAGTYFVLPISKGLDLKKESLKRNQDDRDIFKVASLIF